MGDEGEAVVGDGVGAGVGAGVQLFRYMQIASCSPLKGVSKQRARQKLVGLRHR